MDATAVETVSPHAQWLALAIIAGGSASIGAAGCLLGELLRRKFLVQEMPGRAFWKWAILIGVSIPLLNGLVVTYLSSADGEDMAMFSSSNVGVVVITGVAMYAFTWLLVYRWLVHVGVRFPTGTKGPGDSGSSP